MEAVLQIRLEINQILSDLSSFVQKHASTISPQLKRKVSQLIPYSSEKNNDGEELQLWLYSIFSRLIFELIQAHSNTKQREQDVIRLVDEIGCSIREPKLTGLVTDFLIKLFKAAPHGASFERSVMIEYLHKEIDGFGYGFRRKDIEKVVQTLYRCSCFNVAQQEGAPSRFTLSNNIRSSNDMRYQHDLEIICLAQENSIRLSPKSWAYLLHGCSGSFQTAFVQSILDKCQTGATVQELCTVIHKFGDKYNISHLTCELSSIEDLINENCQKGSKTKIDDLIRIRDIASHLNRLRHLFTVRQCRNITKERGSDAS